MSDSSVFAAQVKEWTVRAAGVSRRAFVIAATEVQRSVVDGSPRTGSAGQPVDTGFLKSSWVLSFPTPLSAVLQTGVSYARAIEDGTKAGYDASGIQPTKAQQLDAAAKQGRGAGPRGGVRHVKSVVGGPHSVKRTRAGWKSIVSFAVLEAREEFR